ncbi:hypothetical protein [Streptomyces subrutilus]
MTTCEKPGSWADIDTLRTPARTATARHAGGTAAFPAGRPAPCGVNV